MTTAMLMEKPVSGRPLVRVLMRPFTWGLLGLLTLAPAADAKTIYVVPSGTAGNEPASPYASPETAANDLNTALTAIDSGDTVLVRKGTYYPTETVMVSNSLKNLTFRSYDPDRQNDINREETVFDASNLPTSQYDGVLYLWGDGTTVRNITVDGFTFKNSRSRAIVSYYSDNNCIQNCIFTNNAMTAGILPSGIKRYGGAAGGAVKVFMGTGCLVSNCVFTANRSTSANGGGCSVYYTPGTDWKHQVVDCTFEGNLASGGGGVDVERARVSRCRFKDNSSTPSGQGGSIRLVTAGLVEDCTFTGNTTAHYGDAIVFVGDGGIVRNCSFTDLASTNAANSTSLLTFKDLSSGHVLKIENCTFSGLSKFYSIFGSGYYDEPDAYQVYVRNCLFFNIDKNLPVVRSGRTWGVNHFENCTIDKTEGSISTVVSGDRHVTNEWVNCIFRGTAPSSAFADSADLVTSSYAGDNPGFVSSANGDYRLYSRSVCLDCGTTLDWHAGATDLKGNPRQVGSTVDLGCLERQANEEHVVKRLVATEEEKTGDWADAYTDWQAAVDAVAEALDAELLVKSGTYRPSATIHVSALGATIRGEGAATTILDGQNARRIMYVDWGETVSTSTGGLTEKMPKYDRAIRLEGITFRNGRASEDDGSVDAGVGGGLLLYGRAPNRDARPSVVADCRFENCTAVRGGGAATWGGIFTNCTFVGNVATNGGGLAGAQCRYHLSLVEKGYELSSAWYVPALLDCFFTNNVAQSEGAVSASSYGDGASVYITGCRFIGNALAGATYQAGSCISRVTACTVSNCLFAANGDATKTGFGVLNVAKGNVRGSKLTFVNNTIGFGAISTGTESPTGNVFDSCTFTDTEGYAFIGSGVTFRNTLFDNRNVTRECICKYRYTQLTFENCTIIGPKWNSPICFHSDTTNNINFVNTIIWSSDATIPLYSGQGTVTGRGGLLPEATAFTNCCLYAAPPSDTTLSVTNMAVLCDTVFSTKPGFVDAANRNWATRTSVCRDKGRMLGWMSSASADLAGLPRVVTQGKTLQENPSALPDIGCYENQSVTPGTVVIIR